MASVHLHVLHHGMWGNSHHLAEAAKHLRERFPKSAGGAESSVPEVDILLCQSNHEDGTYDGIDWGAERAVEEIDDRIRTIEESGRKVTRFSITGYSLGGLVARYIVGILHYRNFFDTVTPVNFTTIATPHLGLLRYDTLISKMTNTLGPNLLGRTGTQFYAKDRYADTERPLIEIMADKDLLFYKALALFQSIIIFANAVNDRTVPYVTAAFEPYDPFVTSEDNKLELEFEQGYAPLLKSFSVKEKTTEGETPKQPKQSLSVWLQSKKPALLAGPFREWSFPLNVMLISIAPLLLPIILVAVSTRFALSSHFSHARVKLLENDPDSMARRLIAVWAKIEKDVVDAVEDVVEESILPAAYGVSNGHAAGAKTSRSTPTLNDHVGSNSAVNTLAAAKSQPLLTPAQHRMITNLNSLPNLTKHVAFIDPVRNAHSMIICRNMASMPSHAKGKGVLRAWADGMKL